MVINTQITPLKKDNRNQHFSTFDVLSVLFSIAIVLVISFSVFNKAMNRKKSDIAKTNMENLAQDLIQKPVIYTQAKNSREIASTPELGLDPWGNNYVYNIIKNAYGQPVYLVIMSPGPNSKLDTAIEMKPQMDISQIERIHFERDDVGYVKSFR